MLCIRYTMRLKRVLSPNFLSAAFMSQKRFIYVLVPPNRHVQCGAERWGGQKVILAALLPHMEVQQSAQPLLISNDGLFKWSAQPLRDHRMRKREDEH